VSIAVGLRLRLARERARMSQEALAGHLGVTQTAVSYWEAGKRDMSVDDLLNATAVLGVKACVLLPVPNQANPGPGETGHELSRRLIAKHGTDRYPDVTAQALKVAAEVGELADAILKHQTMHDGCPGSLTAGPRWDCPHVAKEYADAGLALYALGDKLGLDLTETMRQVVGGETRVFGTGVTSP
jgi:transcriptional regulator with XRE-family HTH domain